MTIFCNSIAKLLAENMDAPLLVHVDIFRARAAIAPKTPPNLMRPMHLDALEACAGPRPIWFPVFNYDFTKTRVYRPASDESQVGSLNEYARTNWAIWRAGPPIFNFCGKSEPRPAVAEVGKVTPFAGDSIFSLLRERNGTVLMYGAPFLSFTSIHYIESLSGGPMYRYDKSFAGEVEDRVGNKQSVDLVYHVRPMGRRLEYDWSRLQSDAESRGLITSVQSPGGEALHVRFAELCQHWITELRSDPLFLLSQETRTWVRSELSRVGGRRFVISDFEESL